MKPLFVDLFAGIGGFHHALKGLGGQCVLAVEIDPACQQVYRASFPDLGPQQLISDIRSITGGADGTARSEAAVRRVVPDHDVLCAGFPCQPFSKSGAQLGVRDRTRGTLFYDIMTIVRARQPRYVVLENVRNIAGPRHVDTWNTIIESLREAGYATSDEPVVFSPHLLSPDRGGTPQVRDRVFILGKRIDGGAVEDRFMRPLVAREPSPGWEPMSWRIASWLEPESGMRHPERYDLRDEELGWIEAWNALCAEIRSDWLPGFPIWADAFVDSVNVPSDCPDWKASFLVKNAAFYRENRKTIDRWRKHRWGPLRQRLDEFPPSRRKFEWQAREWQPRREDRDLNQLVVQFRPSGIRVKPPTYLPALVAITQTSVLGPGVTGERWRRLTPREAAKLQGFPPDVFDAAGVDDAVAYRQLGNAVNVGVVRHLVQRLIQEDPAPSLLAAV